MKKPSPPDPDSRATKTAALLLAAPSGAVFVAGTVGAFVIPVPVDTPGIVGLALFLLAFGAVGTMLGVIAAALAVRMRVPGRLILQAEGVACAIGIATWIVVR
jgi:hypothetical protein